MSTRRRPARRRAPLLLLSRLLWPLLMLTGVVSPSAANTREIRQWPAPTAVPYLGSAAHALVGMPPTDAPPLGASADSDSVLATPEAQQLAEQATLETRQPEVQWSPAGSVVWQTVDSQQTVSAGDRVRTGMGASARLIYFEGTIMEIAASTGLLVERLDRTDTGNIVGRFFQSAGTIVSRVVQLVDPTAGFEVETPAATAFVRGTTLRVAVAANGTTVVTNLPDDSGGLVNVVGKDPATSLVVLLAGQETRIVPGQPPAPAAPQGTFSLSGGLPEPEAGPSQAQQQRQQQRQQQQQLAEQQVAQAQAGLAAAELEAQRLAQQAVALEQQIGALINATVTPGVSSQPPSGVFIAPLPAGPAVPCARGPSQICSGTLVPAPGSPVSGAARGVQTGPQSWTVTLSGLLPGTAAAVVLQTTRGFETLPCPLALPVGPTMCQGSTLGVGLEGGAILVLVNSLAVARGTILGTNPTGGTLTATAVATPTPTVSTAPSATVGTATATPTGALIATPTATATATSTPRSSPSATMIATAAVPGTMTPITASSPTLTATVMPTPIQPTTSPTPTATPLPAAACVPSGAVCQALISPPAGPTAGGIVVVGPCPTPTTPNCLQFSSTGGAVSVQGVITGAGTRPVDVDLPVVDQTGTPQGSQTIVCSPLSAGQADCAATLPGLFPQLGGSVAVSR
jgi:FecR protein